MLFIGFSDIIFGGLSTLETLENLQDKLFTFSKYSFSRYFASKVNFTQANIPPQYMQYTATVYCQFKIAIGLDFIFIG